MERDALQELPRCDRVCSCALCYTLCSSMSALSYRYVMLGTAPQLAHAYGQLSRFNDSYGKQHWDSLLELLSYMRNNRTNDTMHISRGAGSNLVAFCDADWNASYDSKSTIGWIVFLGATPISWCSRMQKSTALSTAQAEYVSLASVSQELTYIQSLMKSLRVHTFLSRQSGR